MAGSRRKRLGVIAGVAVGAVFATGIWLWATDSGPFKDAYCWGAWQQNSGPHLLGDEAVDESGAERRGTESAPPAAGRPQGTCTVEVASDDDEDKELLYGGTRLGAESDDKGYGTAGPRRAVYRAQCQTGPVVFLAEQLEAMDGGRNFLADVMPGYVAAEAARFGCGRVTIELPRD
ncbi:hypothetical protein AB0K02_01140 [Streptomyces sp. NPDC049597]|uniref:hypothetical protein n=1 Tax=Streptomyces sp. NPDC049597 TaxID=3155276 RepID=UPI00343A7234